MVSSNLQTDAWDETIFLGRRNRTETGSRVSSFALKWGRPHAVYFRSDLEPVTQQISRRDGSTRGRAVIEVSTAILALVSVAIFTAHALDAYRSG